MLYLLFVWNSLLITVSATGFYSLRPFKLTNQIHHHQHSILILWLGLALQCLILLLLGTSISIGSILWIMLGIIILTEILPYITRPKRKLSDQSFTRFSITTFRIMGFPLLLSEIMFANLLLKPMTWFDTGLYHLGVIQWLAQYGLVSGLALINQKFGFISSWFAFSAPLTPQFLGDHIGAASNGFLLVLTACTLLLITNHWKRKKTLTLEDTFLFIFLITLSLFYLASYFLGKPILLSFSHDLVVNYSVGIFAWMILLISRVRKESMREWSGRNRYFFWNIVFNFETLLVVLAFCILSFKLTGLFLIPIAYLFFLLQDILNWKRWLTAFLIGAVLILPLAIAQIKTSGCFLYPAQTFCLDLPWTVPSDAIASEAEPVIGVGIFAILFDNFPTSLVNGWHAVEDAWNYSFKMKFGITLLWVISGITVWCIIIRDKTPSGELWLLATALGGSLFIFSINQYVIFRFGAGIILLLPIYLGSLILHILWRNFSLITTANPQTNCQASQIAHVFDVTIVDSGSESSLGFPPSSNAGSKHPNHLILNLVLLFIASTLAFTHNSTIGNNLLLPPVLPKADVYQYQTNDVSYTMPSYWPVPCLNGDSSCMVENVMIQCWNADLPCAPNPVPNIRLRSPSVGVREGFMLVNNGEFENK